MNVKMASRRAVLEKLAQQQDQDMETRAYLKRALATAMANAMISGEYSTVINKTTQNTYQVIVQFTHPPKYKSAKQKLLDNFYRYIKANKPELDGKVALTFTN